MTEERKALANALISLLMFIVGITILIPSLTITLLAVTLVVIADECFTREIKRMIKWRME